MITWWLFCYLHMQHSLHTHLMTSLCSLVLILPYPKCLLLFIVLLLRSLRTANITLIILLNSFSWIFVHNFRFSTPKKCKENSNHRLNAFILASVKITCLTDNFLWLTFLKKPYCPFHDLIWVSFRPASRLESLLQNASCTC